MGLLSWDFFNHKIHLMIPKLRDIQMLVIFLIHNNLDLKHDMFLQVVAQHSLSDLVNKVYQLRPQIMQIF